MLIRVTYSDPTKPPAETRKLGAFVQIACKRKFGLAAIGTPDPEIALYGLFVELYGPQKAADDTAFDAWLQSLEDFTITDDEADDEDPTEAETSTEPSDASPPTSE